MEIPKMVSQMQEQIQILLINESELQDVKYVHIKSVSTFLQFDKTLESTFILFEDSNFAELIYLLFRTKFHRGARVLYSGKKYIDMIIGKCNFYTKKEQIIFHAD